MARDPLAVLWRLRDAAVTETSRDLVTARARELQELRQLNEYRQLIRHEQSLAACDDVAAFAAWLPHTRHIEDRLQANLQAEAARVGRLQQILLTRRTDAEAVAKAVQRQRAEAERVTAAKEQAIMDEAASRAGRSHQTNICKQHQRFSKSPYMSG
jgi:flagellar export protein FliJ